MEFPSHFNNHSPLDLLDFEPQTRARSNTWPCRPTEIEQPAPPSNATPHPYTSPNSSTNDLSQSTQLSSLMLLQKKSTSRRNAWGNMSYADLITQAISSSPEKRLTLSQIYDWMVGNVGYFKDKGDSNSSAGWKNSIRHNLSLHNRFVRVQNEGTGKSSWWMLNPDAKPGKAARRRATSMETSKFEKKRGRIRKKIEAMRNGTTLLDTPSPGSSLGELDNVGNTGNQWEEPTTLFPQQQQQQLSPQGLEFRARASSNASSCGRLSPILSNNTDLHDNQVPPLSPWVESYYSNDRFSAEQLVGGLGAVKLEDRSYYFHESPHNNQQQIQEQTETTQLNEFFRRPELDFNFVENLAPFDPCDVDQVLGNELDLINWEMQQQQQQQQQHGHSPIAIPTPQQQQQPLPTPLLLSNPQHGYNQVVTTTSGNIGRQWVA